MKPDMLDCSKPVHGWKMRRALVFLVQPAGPGPRLALQCGAGAAFLLLREKARMRGQAGRRQRTFTLFHSNRFPQLPQFLEQQRRIMERPTQPLTA
jgi:hypothetical protein